MLCMISRSILTEVIGETWIGMRSKAVVQCYADDFTLHIMKLSLIICTMAQALVLSAARLGRRIAAYSGSIFPASGHTHPHHLLPDQFGFTLDCQFDQVLLPQSHHMIESL